MGVFTPTALQTSPITQEIPDLTWDFFQCPRQESNLRPLVPESELGCSSSIRFDATWPFCRGITRKSAYGGIDWISLTGTRFDSSVGKMWAVPHAQCGEWLVAAVMYQNIADDSHQSISDS